MEVFSVDANRKALLRCSSVKKKKFLNNNNSIDAKREKTLRTGDQVTEV